MVTPDRSEVIYAEHVEMAVMKLLISDDNLVIRLNGGHQGSDSDMFTQVMETIYAYIEENPDVVF